MYSHSPGECHKLISLQLYYDVCDGSVYRRLTRVRPEKGLYFKNYSVSGVLNGYNYWKIIQSVSEIGFYFFAGGF